MEVVDESGSEAASSQQDHTPLQARLLDDIRVKVASFYPLTSSYFDVHVLQRATLPRTAVVFVFIVVFVLFLALREKANSKLTMIST